MKLWTMLEIEYRVHINNFKFELFNKFLSILMNIYSIDIQNYIADFHDIFEKFKIMKYKLNE